MSKPVSETITIELLPETTSTSTESVTKVEKDVVPVQIVKNSIEENTDSTETGSNTPKDDYAYYDDDQYDYYSMNPKKDPYAHPEDISTNILTGIILKKRPINAHFQYNGSHIFQVCKIVLTEFISACHKI